MQYEPQRTLPEPAMDSAAHSTRVSEHIGMRIDAAGGSISFAEFMHEALYAPGLGYYAAGTKKFGEAGDFVTAPEVSSVFGRVLARQIAELNGSASANNVMEIGAGSGKLAVDMLLALQQLDALPDSYQILEVSADLQQRQQEKLQSEVPHLFDRIHWLSGMPAAFSGVIVANEVLDALPVERFVRRAEGAMQLRVGRSDAGFSTQEAKATRRLDDSIAGIEADLGHTLADGYVSDVCLAAQGWIDEVAACLDTGAILLFDYGVSRREYYAVDRSDGWLRCHFRHHAHNDPLINVGIQDITAWVDFSAIAAAAVANDLDILGFQTQSQFLLSGGLQTEMEQFAALPPVEQMKLTSEIKTLTLPGEMGENFKCMGLARGDIATPTAFQFTDRTKTL
ncbi:MAG: SAM-dependent methyltransferase [Gammaproteobacteria bacterium]|nr:SAM-dependent methyltransferase [Gammaproteobacteria bacterium]